jgi:hypothetical protein
MYMKQFALDLLENVYNEIRRIEMEEEFFIEKSMRIIPILQVAYDELKIFIRGYPFCTETEEIYFFKEIKPQILSNLIFYISIHEFEINRPTVSIDAQKGHVHRQLGKLNDFFESNIDFYRYYRTRRTDLDKHYFLRKKQDIQLSFDSFYCEMDPTFSTRFDSLLARIMANEKFSIYLNSELTKFDLPSIEQLDISNYPKYKETWTDTKASLVELIYAIYSTGSINNGKCELKRLATYFENVFNIELGDIYRTFIEIRGRKGNRVQYLDELRKNLIARMDELDNQ